MKKYLPTALKIFFAVLLQLALLELVLTVFFAYRQDYDAEMWKYTRDLKINVSDARAHVHRASGSAKLMGVEVSTNKLGLRDPEPTPDWNRNDKSLAVLALGDSFTLGWGVEAASAYPALLQHHCEGHLWDRTVVNAGIGNYNLEQVAASAAKLIPATRPDAVLYGFYWNDSEPTQREPDSWLARHSHLLLFWRKVQVRLLHFGGNQQNSYLDYYASTFEGEGWTRFEKAARDLSDWARLRKTTLYVALLPELRVPNDPKIKAIYDKVEKLFRSLGAQTVNLLGKLPPRGPEDYWVAPDDPHPNALAHHEIAKLIEKQFWPDCARP